MTALSTIINHLRTSGGSAGLRADYSHLDRVSFSFPANAGQFDFFTRSEVREGFSQLSDFRQERAALAFKAWADVITTPVVLQGVDRASANIRFGQTDDLGVDEDAAGFATTGLLFDHTDVWIDSSLGPPFIGSFTLNVYLHEIGHALGLTHPGNYNGKKSNGEDVPPTYENARGHTEDTQQYTLMSYFAEGSDDPADTFDEIVLRASFSSFNSGADRRFEPTTPLLHDIAAIQSIYGANMETRTEDNIYGFNTNAGVAFDFAGNGRSFSIWDAGGIDTIDASQSFSSASALAETGSATSARESAPATGWPSARGSACRTSRRSSPTPRRKAPTQ